MVLILLGINERSLKCYISPSKTQFQIKLCSNLIKLEDEAETEKKSN